NADMTFFEDCSFVLQCDRRGYGEFITNACGVALSSRRFKTHIEPILKDYGYVFADGSMTDVMALKEKGLKVSCANIACGYYNPHQDTEYVWINAVEQCCGLVFEIINQWGFKQFFHHPTVKTAHGYGRS